MQRNIPLNMVAKKKRRALLSALLLLSSPLLITKTYAADIYTEVNANYMLTAVDVAEFNPVALEGRLGFYIEPQVGIEVHASTGVANDDDLDIETDFSYAAGVAARFESPEQGGGKVFFLLGYAVTELDMDRSGTGKPGKEAFDGFTFGGGFEFRLGKSRNWFLNLKAQRFYSENEIDIDGASLGLRYGF